jgi:hypothetical protein
MTFLNVRMDEDLKLEYDIAVKRARSNLQTATAEAVQGWIDKQQGQKHGGKIEEHAPLVAALLYALRTSSPTKVHQIELMLKPFLNAAPALEIAGKGRNIA